MARQSGALRRALKSKKSNAPDSTSHPNKALLLLVDESTRELLLVYNAKHQGWGGLDSKSGGFDAAASKLAEIATSLGIDPEFKLTREHVLTEMELGSNRRMVHLCLIRTTAC